MAKTKPLLHAFREEGQSSTSRPPFSTPNRKPQKRLRQRRHAWLHWLHSPMQEALTTEHRSASFPRWRPSPWFRNQTGELLRIRRRQSAGGRTRRRLAAEPPSNVRRTFRRRTPATGGTERTDIQEM